MSKCTQCSYIIPHYFLRVIPMPKIIVKAQELRMLIDESLVQSENKINKEHSKSVEELFGSIENMNKLLSIKSRYYVGSGHGKVAEDHGAVCCDCDSGAEDLVFCKCTQFNNYSNYEKYTNHCFWKMVPSSLHELGRKEGGD